MIPRIKQLMATGMSQDEASDIAIDEHFAVRDAYRDANPFRPAAPAPTPTAPAPPVSDRTAAARAALAAVHQRVSDAEGARELLIAEGTADRAMVDAMNDNEALWSAHLEDRPLSAADQAIADAEARYASDPRAEMLRSSQAELRRDWYRLSPAQRASDAEAYGLDVATVEAEMRQTRAASDEQRDFPTRRDFENQRARAQS